MFQTIVVPLDGSQLARQALPVATRIARSLGATLYLVRVAIPPFSPFMPVYDFPLYLPRVEQEDHRQATAYLEEVAALPELRGLKVITNAFDGDPASAILDAAHQWPAPLIVVSSHGDTGLKRWVLGSVATKIIHHSRDPVLLLRPEGARPLLEPSRVFRWLVPLDGSLLSEEAVLPAIALTQALSASEKEIIHLACVLPCRKVAKNAHLMEDAYTYIAGVKQRLDENAHAPGLTILTSILTEDDVASALLSLAETGKGMEPSGGEARCDGIALATHGWGAIQRWTMGSISERLVNTTRLPLLIVRPKRSAG